MGGVGRKGGIERDVLCHSAALGIGEHDVAQASLCAVGGELLVGAGVHVDIHAEQQRVFRHAQGAEVYLFERGFEIGG